MLKTTLLLVALIFSFPYQVQWDTYGLLKDSLTIRAFGGQATPYSGSSEAGALFPFNPSSTPFPSHWLVEAPATGSALFFSLVFHDSIVSNIALAEYRFYPAGSYRDTSLVFTRMDSLFYATLDSAALSNGICGQVRVIDNNNNFYALDYNRLPRIARTWTFNPNRWYAVKPSRNSRRLISALCDRPSLYEDMGQKFLYCYYKNGGFHDFSDKDDLSGLKLTDAFLVYLTEPFSFPDTLESVLLDSAYLKPVRHVLSAGWNLVANPYHYPVCVSNVVSTNAISPFFSFSDSSNAGASYYNLHSPLRDSTDVLRPFEGYWVKSDTAGTTLTFYPYSTPVAGLGKAAPDSSWVLSVKNTRSDILLGKNLTPMRVAMPPSGKGQSLFSDEQLAVNIKPMDEEGFVSRIALDKGVTHDFILKGCKDDKSIIYIADNKTAIPMCNGVTCQVPAGNFYEVYFLSGSAAFVDSGITGIRSRFPEAFSMSGNFPNPCNPVTRIKYGVPFELKGQPLSFSVYDIRGKTIYRRTLEAIPGFHTLEWDLKDNRGKPVSSGYFIGRITVNKTSKSIKMAVIK